MFTYANIALHVVSAHTHTFVGTLRVFALRVGHTRVGMGYAFINIYNNSNNETSAKVVRTMRPL